ncbi:MAG: RlpA-like double-psi beta-barrel domain-containing protein, partial [Pseudomonadota bacterium]
MQKQILKLFTFVLSIGLLAGCAELELASHVVKQSPIPASSKTKGTFKVGNPYKIAGQTYYPRETYSFEQTGIASWYGPNFHGKKTANGEIFDMYELTAAHKTLQMPSLVRVTNLENGKS